MESPVFGRVINHRVTY